MDPWIPIRTKMSWIRKTAASLAPTDLGDCAGNLNLQGPQRIRNRAGPYLFSSVADPVSGAFFDPWIPDPGWEKNQIRDP